MEAARSFKGDHGLELTSVDWLVDHHRTKELERRQMVEDLELKPGQVVLDLGCGPGLWTQLLAEQVEPNGKVIGADLSPSLIRYAVNVACTDAPEVTEFVLADFYRLPFADDTFDAVFFGNCLAYVPDPLALLDEHNRVTRPGGRIIAKDYDGAVIIFHPLDVQLSLTVLRAAARALVEKPLNPPFDNFVGRKLHGIFVRAGFEDVSTRTYAIQRVAPLQPEAKRYISGNAGWYGRTAAPYLSSEELQRWLMAFEPESETYILDRD
ncbi:MAG TPA: methyltransferase domain-containing protein, partial [Nitriliruptorales bacterium]|nr:methyltransferase domain-containing protein [Nitriliruptorales bacterium]